MNQIKLVANNLGLAGLVSMLSLLAAWSAIYFVLQKDAKLTVVFSVVAFLLDIVDGQIARRLNKDSAFGRTLDSLVDLVNYSVLAGLATQLMLVDSALGFFTAFLIVAFGVIRLALFTVNGFDVKEEKLYYRGVVTPHLTLAVSVLYLINHFFTIEQWLIALVLSILAIGQVSTIRTRKTGVLIFWIPVSLLLVVGALVWL